MGNSSLFALSSSFLSSFRPPYTCRFSPAPTTPGTDDRARVADTTAPGQSGSPLLLDNGGRYVVVGVHRDQNLRTGQAWGVWIDDEKFGRIRNYVGDCS